MLRLRSILLTLALVSVAVPLGPASALNPTHPTRHPMRHPMHHQFHSQKTVTFDETVPPGANYDKAEFRLWMPQGVEQVQAIAVLMPGSNGDGRSMAEDTVWQAFATRHRVALVACHYTDKPHEQSFIEEYINASGGSGQALLNALKKFSRRTKHDELNTAPFLLWGMSAGGEFNYEFAAWKPERVVAFVVNKGGIYYTALAPHATRNVPGILFVGEKDLEFRTYTISGLFAVNRRAGAVWAYAEEPGAAHIVGRSRDMAMIYFAELLPLRLGSAYVSAPAGSTPPPPTHKGMPVLAPLVEKAGFIGDLKTRAFQAVAVSGTPGYPTAWLPTERVARAWQALVTGKPFDATPVDR